jgi:hypothetical protein
VAFAVAGGGHGVDRVDAVVGTQHCFDDESPVLLDADNHLFRFLGVFAQQLVQHPNAGKRVGDPLSGENLPRLVEDADVVVGLGPVHSDENHVVTSLDRWNRASRATAAN